MRLPEDTRCRAYSAEEVLSFFSQSLDGPVGMRLPGGLPGLRNPAGWRVHHAVLVSPLDESIHVAAVSAEAPHPGGMRPHGNPFRVSRLDSVCCAPAGPGAAALPCCRFARARWFATYRRARVIVEPYQTPIRKVQPWPMNPPDPIRMRARGPCWRMLRGWPPTRAFPSRGSSRCLWCG